MRPVDVALAPAARVPAEEPETLRVVPGVLLAEEPATGEGEAEATDAAPVDSREVENEWTVIIEVPTAPVAAVKPAYAEQEVDSAVPQTAVNQSWESSKVMLDEDPTRLMITRSLPALGVTPALLVTGGEYLRLTLIRPVVNAPKAAGRTLDPSLPPIPPEAKPTLCRWATGDDSLSKSN